MRGHLVWWPLTRNVSASLESFPEQSCPGGQLSQCLLHSLSYMVAVELWSNVMLEERAMEGEMCGSSYI